MATLPLRSLAEVLASLPMPRGFESCAPSWRCRLAPEVDDEHEMLDYFDQGIPVFAPRQNASAIHEAVPDALEFVTNPQWNAFPKPKVAFKQGWAGPGTSMEDEQLHSLVNSFDEVFKAADRTGTILNLQYFHRDDPTAHPPIPAMSRMLQWPSFFEKGPGSAVCDNATRISKRGAATWWHLDDSGEFVMQTALNNRQHEPGTQPVKIFIYGPRGSYDWTSHDARTDESGKIVGLHLFDQLKEEEFPPSQYLPVWTVAVLRAGGRPLVSPPNIPHLVITCNDCVMVEQRRVSNLFLDEVSYLLRRVQHWQTMPILYRYLRHDLQDAAKVGAVVELLKARDGDADITGIERKRLLASLLSVARFPAYFAVPGCQPRKPIDDAIQAAKDAVEEDERLGGEDLGAEERRRRAAEEQQKAQLGDGSATGDEQTPAEEAYRTELMRWCASHGASVAMMDELERYWDVTASWVHGPGCVFTIGPKAHCGVVYPNSRPLYGPVRTTPEEALADAEEMSKTSEDGGAWSVKQLLAKRKAHALKDDALLDELF
jgi:hypothetical protein